MSEASDWLPDRSAERDDFRHFTTLQTRWNDHDGYRHVNNAHYHTYFDSAIMDYLLVQGGFDVLHGPIVPFTVENRCRYYRAVSFPEIVEVGLRVARLGDSSVRYALGIFCRGDTVIRAGGTFIDVFVTVSDGRPASIPTAIRAHLARLLSAAPG